MQIRNVLFDAGGTLVFPNFRRIADEFAQDGVFVDPDALAAAEARVRFEIDRPDLVRATDDRARWNLHMENLCRAAGVTRIPTVAFARLKAYHDAENLWEVVPDDVRGVIESLARTYRLGVVSNANGTIRAKFERVGLAAYFETIVDSEEEGVEKPDPRLFRVALDRMNLRPEETVYVGDIWSIDVVGAHAAGLHAVLLDPLGLYADRPCPRIARLEELATALGTLLVCDRKGDLRC